MYKILIATHGRMCEGILDTLKIFSNDLDHVETIPYYVEGVDSEGMLSNYINMIKDEDVVIVFTDVMMGSVNQAMITNMNEKSNVHILSGCNLPLILEFIACNPDSITSEFIEEKVLDCMKSIVYMNDYEVVQNNMDE